MQMERDAAADKVFQQSSSSAGLGSHAVQRCFRTWLPALLTWLQRLACGRAANLNYLAYAAASGVKQFRRTEAPQHLVAIRDGQVVPHLEHVVVVLVHTLVTQHAPLIDPPA